MSPAARGVTLALLATVYAFGFADRVVIALVAQQLKAEFAASDLQIGLLGGTAFALVNVCASLPLARLADRTSRRLVAAGSLLVGSLFTAACGLVSGFGQMLALRLGMAAGSAGTEAPAHALISDLYPPDRRPLALSLFMLGVPLASVVGSTLGGVLAERHGWRATFLLFGAAGMVVALGSALAMREPPRGQPGSAQGMPVGAVGAAMWASPAFRHVVAGTGLVGLASFAVNTFLPAFFARSHGLGPGEAGLVFGLVSGGASALGTLLGGYGSTRLARRGTGWLIAWPGLGLLVGSPVMLAGVAAPGLAAAVPLIALGSTFSYMAMGPAIAILHGLLPPAARATGSALFLAAIYLVGQGLGPPLAGWVSDGAAAWYYGHADFLRDCAGPAGQVTGSVCADASAAGLRLTLALFVASWLWSGTHYLLAARRLGGHAAVPA